MSLICQPIKLDCHIKVTDHQIKTDLSGQFYPNLKYKLLNDWYNAKPLLGSFQNHLFFI